VLLASGGNVDVHDHVKHAPLNQHAGMSGWSFEGYTASPLARA
jgi:hypothetical protein